MVATLSSDYAHLLHPVFPEGVHVWNMVLGILFCLMVVGIAFVAMVYFDGVENLVGEILIYPFRGFFHITIIIPPTTADSEYVRRRKLEPMFYRFRARERNCLANYMQENELLIVPGTYEIKGHPFQIDYLIACFKYCKK